MGAEIAGPGNKRTGTHKTLQMRTY